MLRYLILLVFLMSFHWACAEKSADLRSFTISGYVRDGSTGEELIGANVYVKKLSNGTITNQYGYYSLSLPPGNYLISYSYIGYTIRELNLSLKADTILNINLQENAEPLDEIVVTSRKRNENITSLETGTIELPIQMIRKMPAFMGEVDIIKSIQLLLGVQSAAEGSSGFSVRGGDTDQNLILLDQATIYNASHFFGFFSVFNNDAIKDVKLYKGDIPASYGGRLASLLDVRMKTGNTKKFSGEGGIGTISSRLTLEGPIGNEKSSFLMSGRRTYADLFLPFAKQKDIRDNKLFFYDLNGKLSHIFNDENRIFISGYTGSDVFKNQFAGLSYGNIALSAEWNHVFNPRLFSNFTLLHSNYRYRLATPDNQPQSFEWVSSVNDYGLRADFNYYANPMATMKFGLISVWHHLRPGKIYGKGEGSAVGEFLIPESHALEHGIYFQGEEKVKYRWSVKYGLRLSIFQNVGPGTIYTYNQNHEAVDSTTFQPWHIFNTYVGLEPRLGINYSLNDNNSLKASYTRTKQYLQLAMNSTAGTPLSVWFPASPNVKPQVSDQYSLGYFRDFHQHAIETSVEIYYKAMQNTIDFRDHAVLLLNPELEGELRIGKAWAYGMEVLVRWNENHFSGWISYTLSRSRRQISGINQGKPYNSPYDKPNDVSVVMNYDLTKRLLIGANWIFSSGMPTTFPIGRYEILHRILPLYSGRNDYRLDDYHRLDLSLTLRGKRKSGRSWHSEWNLSIYNAYGRKNTWAINFVQDEKNPEVTYAEKTYLFSVVPALTYNFKF